jgi:hypothetical protein
VCLYCFCDCLSFNDLIYTTNVLNDYNNKEELVPKITSPIKTIEISFRTHEENEGIYNQISKLEDQINELRVRSITTNDVVNTQSQINYIENKMNENNK